MNDLASSTILQRKSLTDRIKWLPKPNQRRHGLGVPTASGQLIRRQSAAARGSRRGRSGVPYRSTSGSLSAESSQKSVIIYARISSQEQKLRSIDCQEVRCKSYIDTELDRAEHVLMSDPGLSGTLLQDRPNLIALLELVKARKVAHIVVEAMDRLTRVIWDATRIGELLEAYGVQLHVWNLGRSVTRQELLDEAKRAEADRERRVEVISDGIYDLIRRGGMTVWPFGYQKSDIPGFPVRVPEKAKAVKRAFELAPYNSDSEVAKILSREGFIGPNGTTRWDKWDVQRILGNLIYIGVNNFRKTDQETERLLDEEHQAGFGDINVRINVVKNNFRREVDEWVVGYNEERYAIVTDEEFVKADRAREARRRGPGGSTRAGQKSSRDPFVNPICDCPERNLDQCFHFVYNAGNGASMYQCSQQRGFHGCRSAVGQSGIRLGEVQRVVLNALRKHALPLCESADYRADFVERIRARVADDDLRRALMQRKYDELDAKIERMLNDAIGSGFNQKRLDNKVAELEKDLLQKASDIAKLPKIDPDTIDIEAAAGELSEAFDLVGNRLPFKPENENEARIASKLQSMIGGVVVRRENVPVGQAEIEVALDLEGFVLGANEHTERSWIIEREQIRAMWTLKSSEKMTAALDELAASGRYGLTDAQWEIVEPHLPDMTKTFGKIRYTMSTRAIADACIFKYRTGAYQLRLPQTFGNPNEMRALIPRFVRYGGMAEIIARLSEADPSWAKGLEVPEFTRWSLRKNSTWLFEDGRDVAVTWAAEGRFSLTKAQFQAIEPLIDPNVLKPSRGRQALNGRQLIDGIILKLRSRVTWYRMPVPWGKGSDFSRAAAALAACGNWKKIVEALRDKFPEVLDGLSVDIIDRHGVGNEKRKERNTTTKDRAKRNSKGIFANIGQLLKSATADTDFSVGFSGARVRLPGKVLLRPKVVVGPADTVLGKIFMAPTIIVERGNHIGLKRTNKTVAPYRAARSTEHILMVSTARMRIDHHQRKDGKWICRVLKKGDAVVVESMNVHLPLHEIYAGAEI